MRSTLHEDMLEVLMRTRFGSFKQDSVLECKEEKGSMGGDVGV